VLYERDAVTIQGYREIHCRIGKAVYDGDGPWRHAKALELADGEIMGLVIIRSD
jgi:hypothetical protein